MTAKDLKNVFSAVLFFYMRWYGGIGRRKGLKIPRWQHRAGSSPATSTVLSMNPHFQLGAEVDSFFCLKYLKREEIPKTD